jgi:hypothetical protein
MAIHSPEPIRYALNLLYAMLKNGVNDAEISTFIGSLPPNVRDELRTKSETNYPVKWKVLVKFKNLPALKYGTDIVICVATTFDTSVLLPFAREATIAHLYVKFSAHMINPSFALFDPECSDVIVPSETSLMKYDRKVILVLFDEKTMLTKLKDALRD